MSEHTRTLWQQAFAKRLGTASFRGTDWENLYEALSRAPLATAKSASPIWVGIELTHPAMNVGYTGILCADNLGKILSISELQRRTGALKEIRNDWPGPNQLRFVTDIEDLQIATRRSIVFGAVVDAASPGAFALAESIAKTVAVEGANTELRVLSVISSQAGSRFADRTHLSLPLPAAFDVFLQSNTKEPWLEHRDLAVVCGLQRSGMFCNVDIVEAHSAFKQFDRVSGRQCIMRPRPVGAKAAGRARGQNRAEIATKRALNGIAKIFVPSQNYSAIVNVSGDRRLLRFKEIGVVLELMWEALPDIDPFVLIENYSDQGEYLNIVVIAVSTPEPVAPNWKPTY